MDGEGALRRGAYQQAVVSLNRVIALDPSNSKALDFIGEAFSHMNRSLMRSGPASPSSASR